MNITLTMIGLSTFCGVIALDRAVVRRGWQRGLWCLTAAALLTLALGFGDEFLSDGFRTGCWPWAPCETFHTRFNFTVPLFPLPPSKGNRVREELRLRPPYTRIA